jgi:hypothetical protein
MRLDVGDELDAYTYAFLGCSFTARKTFRNRLPVGQTTARRKGP